MIAQWFYIAGSLCFLIGTILTMQTKEVEYEEPEEDNLPGDVMVNKPPWGFVTKDTGVVNGGDCVTDSEKTWTDTEWESE